MMMLFNWHNQNPTSVFTLPRRLQKNLAENYLVMNRDSPTTTVGIGKLVSSVVLIVELSHCVHWC